MYLVGLVLPGIFSAWVVNTMKLGEDSGVIAFLNGVDLRKSLFTQEILAAKILGVICACGSSLAVGPEGPMIHIGAATGVLVLAQCRRVEWFRRVLQGSGGSRSLELHAAAVGAGCGVTAAFWAPLAGTLFVVEEAATYLSPRFFVHVFGASCLSLGVVLLWQQLWQHTGQYSPLFQVFLGPNCSYSEFIYYASCGVIGLICGLLACLFNRIVLELNFLRQRWRAQGHKRVFTLEVVIIAVLSSSLGTLAPAASGCHLSTIQRAFANSNQCIAGEWAHQIFQGRENFQENARIVPAPGLFGVQYNPDDCPTAIFNDTRMPPCNLEKAGFKFPSEIPERERYYYCCGFDDLDSFHQGRVYSFTSPRAPLNLEEEFWPSFGCDADVSANISIPSYRPMAALAFVPGRITVKNLFTRGSPNMLPTKSMLAFLPLYFILAAITSGAAVPSGLVIPMMIIGGCVGRLCGNLLTLIDVWPCPSDWTPEYKMLLKMLRQQSIRTSSSHTCGLPDPGSFAIVGAAAFMSASGSIVLFVIAMMVEITGDISSLLPIAFGAITGRFVVRSFLGHGLYHDLGRDLMQITKLPFLTRECPLYKEERKAPVSSLLRGEPENSLRYLRRRESQASVEALLQDCSHNGFPIVSETGQLVGLVRRSELEGCLLEGQEEVQLDVLADPAPYTVHKDFPVDRAYLLFRDLVPPFFFV
ncbi:clcD [Symbiodinium sp. KB8]|nr:clcD [Symbiodinium sp. KB8]